MSMKKWRSKSANMLFTRPIYETEFPALAEAMAEDTPRQKNGDFVAANGRRFYYRLQLSSKQTFPAGPESFELSLRPFGAR